MTDCQHCIRNLCTVASKLAGKSIPASADACLACAVKQDAFRVNSVTVSLALAAIRADVALSADLLRDYGHLLHAQSPKETARLNAIRIGIGPGSQLWRLLESLGIRHKPACPCLELAERMNLLGPAGCRADRAGLVAAIQSNLQFYGWGELAAAAARALRHGVTWRLDLRDVIGSVLDEAIRLADQAGATAATVPLVPSVPSVPSVPPAAKPAKPAKRPAPQRLMLACRLCPGDLLTLTAAVESLHLTYPGEYETDVRTASPEIWRHNPRIRKLIGGAVRTIDCHYPSIQRCNEESIPFLAGYTEHLAGELQRPLRLMTNRPQLYQSAEELARPLTSLWPGAPDLQALARGRPIWLVVAGVKADYTIKGWPVEYFQEVVDRTAHKICWVQIGLRKHQHPELANVVSLLETGPPMRELILLAHRAAGGLGPVTFLQHLMAAWQRPYICLVGGREPATWVQYPYQHTLHTVGSLDCCREKSCWRARVVKLPDADAKNNSLCQHPVTEGLQRPAARCMMLIEPIEVLALLNRLVS